MFSEFQLANWRQFEEVELQFHPTLTVLTGANGAGKTTILNLLSRHFGWNLSFVSTPVRTKTLVRYFADFWDRRPRIDREIESAPEGHRRIGHLRYASGQRAQLTVPEDVQQEYQVAIRPQQSVEGVFISSHRPVYVYQPVETIPTRLDAREQLLTAYIDEMRQRYVVNTRVRSPSHRIKEALITLATFGYGNQAVTGDPRAVETFEGFQRVLAEVLPRSLGFMSIRVDVPDVVFETSTGQFAFDAVSGGVAAIIDQAWQIFMYSQTHERFSVVIDEPENHLHPELQRTLLPSFLRAFPQVQFIVATHNPFIVGSVPDSRVYVLDYTDDRRVRSQLLDTANKAGTSNEILRDVLGLETTIAVWVEHELDSIVERYQGREFNADTLAELRADMKLLGLDHLFPSAVDHLVKPRE